MSYSAEEISDLVSAQEIMDAIDMGAYIFVKTANLFMHAS